MTAAPSAPQASSRLAAWMAATFLLVSAAPSASHAQAAGAANPTYAAVVDGMSCRQNHNGRLDCTYVVGGGIRFVIEGVGQDEALISFTRVDSTAGYVAGFSPFHGCVVVKPAAAGDSSAALAFVSPRDGRVYRVWQHCRQPTRR